MLSSIFLKYFQQPVAVKLLLTGRTKLSYASNAMQYIPGEYTSIHYAVYTSRTYTYQIKTISKYNYRKTSFIGGS